MANKTFATNLKIARKMRGWSQEQIAIKIGIPRPRYASYEEQRAEPSQLALQAICKALSIPEKALHDFMYDSDFFKSTLV